MSTINGAPPSTASATRSGAKMTSSSDLRTKVVEILSATANGCLVELGYLPGMNQQLKMAEERAQRWQEENTKLFEDNRKLSTALRDVQAIIKVDGKEAWLGYQREMKRETFRLQQDLQRARSDITTLVNERTMLQNRINLLESGQEMRNISKQYEALRSMHETVWQELQSLKGHGRGDMIQPPYMAQQAPVPTQHRRSLTSQQPMVDPVYGQQVSVPLGSRQTIQQGPPNVPNSVNQNAYPPKSSSASPAGLPSRSLSTSSLGSRQHALSINTQIQASTAYQQTPITPVYSSMYIPHAAPMSAGPSAGPRNGVPSFQGTNMNISPHQQPKLSGWPRHVSASSPQHVIPPQSHTSHLPPYPSAAISSHTHGPPHPPTNHSSSSLQHAISPPASACTPISHTRQLSPLFTSRRAVSDPEQLWSSKRQNPQPVASEFSQRRTPSSSSPEQPHEALTPVDIASTPVISGTPRDSLLLKRSSVDMASPEQDILTSEISRKRPRIDEKQEPEVLVIADSPVEEVNNSVEEAVAGVEQMAVADPTCVLEGQRAETDVKPAEADATGVEEMAVEGQPNISEAETTEAEVNMAETILDGLRSLEDALAEIIDQDDENEELMTCLLCMYRYNKGILTEKPQPFVNATMDELVQHCASQHPKAWEKARLPTSSTLTS